MSVFLSVTYKAQLVITLNSAGTEKQTGRNTSEALDSEISRLLDKNKMVNLDPDYVRYGLDVGLKSESKEQLESVCKELAVFTQNHPYLVDFHFESFPDPH